MNYAGLEIPEDSNKLSPGLPSPISPISEGRYSYGSPQSSITKISPVRRIPQRTCPHARTTTEQMASCLRNILLEREGSQSTAIRACCKKTGSGSHADRPESRMPTYDEVTSLLAVFRIYLASIIDPALDRHFVDLVKTPSFTNHPMNRHFLSELILAIAYICVASSTKSIKRKLSAITPDTAIARATAHFKTAQAGFDITGSIENPDVSAVEVLLLMGIYKFLEGSESAAASLAGMAISMAQTLGLNESTPEYSPNEENPEIYNGLWNSLYNFDRVLSLTSSRLCTVPHDLIPLSPTPPISEISLILGKIIQATRCPSSTPEALQPLSNELKTFITALPPSLRWSTILSTNLAQHELIKSLQINALYFCAIFRLTKASLLSTLGRSTMKPVPPSSNINDFSLSFFNSSNSLNHDTLTATHESRWSEAGIYSAQTSLRLFEKAKQNGVSIHGSPLLETWLTLSFLICIAGIFALPSSPGTAPIGVTGGSGRAANPHDIESRLSQLSHMYQGLISNARMSPRLCSLSTYINDLRGYLSRKSEDSNCGKDSFEALFGSAVDDIIMSSVEASNATVDAEAGLEESLLTPNASDFGNREENAEEDSLTGLLPETPLSLTSATTQSSDIDTDGKDDSMAVDLTCSIQEPKIGSEIDDLWQKIFEDLDPEDIEPEGGPKKTELDGLGYSIEGTEDVTALERLIRKSEVFA
ncbi:hypothetical protein H072_2353 [Dactylellina haptotyla CBS 200.50]|uniref:Xylanolytic transcriptional activator regulatory domain-containing protein n=1 Tax=Dactylellina haptotyla (strain CBS 200.50) TaxID=1284197 RepID=S8AL21_DACHA|nr:hypothetical protein H072_2353 [Dactylellina haptotyla CBS 200.50]